MSERDGRVESFALSMDADAPHVAVARMFAAAVARHFACSEEQVQDVKVAISEACSNAIKAHEEAGADAPIEICIRRDPEALSFEIVDTGSGFDFDVTQSPAVPNDASELLDSGIGLVLIQALFPSVEVGANARGGTTVRFEVPLGSIESSH